MIPPVSSMFAPGRQRRNHDIAQLRARRVHPAAVRSATLPALVLAMTVGLSLTSAQPATAAPAIAWHGDIAWVPFDQALARAKAENKAICVVVYANWCPKCRSLAPRFAEQPITGASGDVIMVLQNSDERPEWLKQRFGDLGNYVPRVFFLKPDGTVNTGINSGNAKFPYFYRASEAAQLADSIKRAARAAGPAAVAPPQPSPAAVAQVAAIPPPAPAAATAPSASAIATSSDLPLLALLAALAIGAVWFVSRRSDPTDDAPTTRDD